MKFWLLVLALMATILQGCDKKDACLDDGGCWDSVDNMCRKNEPNAQALCNRSK